MAKAEVCRETPSRVKIRLTEKGIESIEVDGQKFAASQVSIYANHEGTKVNAIIAIPEVDINGTGVAIVEDSLNGTKFNVYDPLKWDLIKKRPPKHKSQFS